MTKISYIVKTATRLILVSIIILGMYSCKQERSFFIEELNMNIDIEFTSRNNMRVFIYSSDKDRGNDYIDIVHHTSDLPNINLCFPLEERKKVYIIDYCDFVKNYVSTDLDLVHLYIETVKNAELISIEKMDRIQREREQIDSVTDSISSITVRLNAYFNDISVWKNQKYLGEIYNRK